MKRVFTKQELAELSPMGEAKNIRGHRKLWTLRGNIFCGSWTSITGAFNARGRVRIGKYCAIGQHVSLNSNNHRTDMPNQQIWLHQRFGFDLPGESKGPVEIGHNVWIGDKVNVLSGVNVGHGAVIGAGATVTKDVPPFSIVVGSPSKIVRQRFTDGVIAQLLEIQWWHWSDERIARNQRFFETAIPADEDMDLFALCEP